jgi:hypothetical protein
MDIEQVSPKKPNFLLILIHLTFRHHARHPTSMLVLPRAAERV